jgi:hypothetical protein
MSSGIELTTLGRLFQAGIQVVKGRLWSGTTPSPATTIQKSLSLEYIVKSSKTKILTLSYKVAGGVALIITETYLAASVRIVTIGGETRRCSLSSEGRGCILEVVV